MKYTIYFNMDDARLNHINSVSHAHHFVDFEKEVDGADKGDYSKKVSIINIEMHSQAANRVISN